MSWREELREGSFRGAPFKVEGHELAGGRRQGVFEFPQRDDGDVQDLGRKARQFTLDMFVLGNDYINARDALLAAFEAGEPGTLIHPYLGTRRVAVLDFRLRETTEEGGVGRFQVTFIEAGKTEAFQFKVYTPVVAVAAADDLKAASGVSFLDRFKTLKFPSFVELDALFVLNNYIGEIRRLAYRLTGQGTPLYALFRQLQTLSDNGPARVRAPTSLVADMGEIATATRLLASTPAQALTAQIDLLGFGEAMVDIPGTTPARNRQRDNRASFVRLARQLAAAEAVKAVAEMEFDSYQAAAAARDDLADRLDQLATDVADAGDDVAYLAITAARVAMIRDVTARGGSLARLYDYRPTATEPALVIAHRLYGDASRDAEIVARNGLAHPCFVPAGVALEVLSDD